MAVKKKAGEAEAEPAKESVSTQQDSTLKEQLAVQKATTHPNEMKSPVQRARTLLQRLAAVQAEVDYIQKEKKQGMKYSIVSHDAVTAKVRPLMVKHGVLYYPSWMDMQQVGNRTQAQMRVRFVNVDNADDWIDVATAGYGIDEQDKGPGKAISYSVKYALLKALGLESGDDPDEDQTTEHRNPADEHNLAMAAFEADVDLATDQVLLEMVASRHKVAIEKASAVYPARVQLARTHYAKKLRQLKEELAAKVKEGR